jgi:competence protein ComEC
MDMNRLLPTATMIKCQGRVVKDITKSTKSKYLVKVDRIAGRDDKWIDIISPTILLHLDALDTLRQGHKITFTSRVFPLQSTTNPYAFDYKMYLMHQRIYQQAFAKSSSIRIIRSEVRVWDDMVFSVKDHCKNLIDSFIPEISSRSVAYALLLGESQLITKDLYLDYANTGAIHVLSVSGLHVTVFISLFIFLLNKVRSQKMGWTLAKILVLSFLVVFYCFLTGLSPSVVRAGIMVIMYLLGTGVFKSHSNYNILAFCCIVMICYEPNLVFDMSFQFSFLALLSILFFYPIIYRCLEPQSKVAIYIWSLISMSLAAQLLVIPFLVYYFHKFPLSFVLSGIVAVPLSSIVIYIGFMMLTIGALRASVGHLLGLLLNYIILFLNSIIHYLADISAFIMEDIFFDKFLLVAFYIMLVAIMSRLTIAKEWQMKSIGIVFVLSISWISWKYFDSRNQSEIIIYDTYSDALVDLFYQGDLYNYKSEALSNNTVEFVAKNNRIMHFIGGIKPMGKVVRIGNKKIIILDDKSTLKHLDNLEIPCHLLYISDNIYPPQDMTIKTNYLVLGRDLNTKIREEWKVAVQADSLHWMQKMGSFRLVL